MSGSGSSSSRTKTPFAEWNDDLAWMEPMHGRPWQTALADEASHLTAVCNIEPIRKTAREFADVLRRADREADAVDIDKDPVAELSSDANHESFDTSDEGYVGVYTGLYGSEFFTAGFWPGPVRSSQLEQSPHWTIESVLSLSSDSVSITHAATHKPIVIMPSNPSTF
jgi:hypothetical protein